MADAQSVVLVGRLTRDPEIRETSNGVACNFGMAVNRKWTNRDGSPGEECLFIDVVAFGRTAEVAHQYRHKGGEVLCDGYLRLEQWEDRQGGGRRSAIKLVANRIQLIGSDGAGGGRRTGQDDQGWMERGGGSSAYGDGGRGGYDDRPRGRPIQGPGDPGYRSGGNEQAKQYDRNRTQQGGRQGSVAGVSYPRRDDGQNRRQNAPQQSRRNVRQPAPRQPQRTNDRRDGQGYPESARNDSYGRDRLPPHETSGVPDFDPDANMSDGNDDPDGYGGDDGPPAIGHVEPGVAPEMQPLADRFDQPADNPETNGVHRGGTGVRQPFGEDDIPF